MPLNPATSLPSNGYLDGIIDLGLKRHKYTWDTTKLNNVATANVNKLNTYLSENWIGGKYLNNLVIPPGLFLLKGQIKDANKMGGWVTGVGHRSYPYPELQQSDFSPFAHANVTQLTRIDGENGTSVVRIDGVGKAWTNMAITGRRWVANPAILNGTLSTRTNNTSGVITMSPGHWMQVGYQFDFIFDNDLQAQRNCIATNVSGNDVTFSGGIGDNLPIVSTVGKLMGGISGVRTPSIIEIIGRADLATGLHTLANLNLSEADSLITSPGGYYNEDDDFVGDENHADQTHVECVEGSNCDNFFYSDNLQSSDWRFDDISLLETGSGKPVTVFNIQRGGDIVADNIRANHGKVIILRVSYYSPHQSYYDIRGFQWDRSTISIADNPGIFLTLFKFDAVGAELISDLSYANWFIRITGRIPYLTHDDDIWDKTRLIDIQPLHVDSGFTLENVLVDFENLPYKRTKFEQTNASEEVEGTGHFWRPINDQWITEV